MSRGDKNLDQLFKDAFSTEEHEFVPGYWQEAQQMIQANKVAHAPFYMRPFFMASTFAVLSLSAFLFLDSTPRSNELTSQPHTVIETQTKVIPLIASSIKDTPMEESVLSNKTQITSNRIPAKDKSISPKQTHSLPITIGAAKETGNASEMPSKEQERSMNIHSVSTTTINPFEDAEDISNSIFKKKAATPILKRTNTPTTTKVNLNEITRNTSTVMFNHSDVSYMNSLPLKNIPFKEHLFMPKALPENGLKRMYTPINLRLSVGYLWSNDSYNENTLVSSNFTEQNIELTAEYLFKKRWGIQSGISWAQTNVSQEHNYPQTIDNSYWTEGQNIETVINRVWWLGGWYYYPNTFDTTVTEVYTNKMDTVTKKEQISHQVQTIEVPILLTYNYANKRFNLQLSSGLSIGTVIHSTGSYYSSLDPFATEVNATQDFKSFQTNFLFRTEVSYGLNDHWWISARPQMKLNLNSVHPNNSTVSPQIFYYGINTGIVYRF